VNAENNYPISIEAQVLGVPLTIRTNHEPILEETLGRFEWSPPATNVPKPALISFLRQNNAVTIEHRGRTMTYTHNNDWPQLDDFIQLVIERERPDLHFLHASAILCRDHAALFVGASTSGKTTLALALSELGYPILAEDTVPLHLNTATALPFRTQMGLRAHTAKLAADHNWQTNYATGHPAPGRTPVRWLFLLTAPRNGNGVAFIPTAPGNATWRDMYTLCYGAAPSEHFTRSNTLCIRNETAFACTPRFHAAPPSTTSLQRLMKHLHPTPQPLAKTLSAAAALLNTVTFAELTPGHLNQTVHLVQQMLQAHPESDHEA